MYTPRRDDEHPRPFHMGIPPTDLCDLCRANCFAEAQEIVWDFCACGRINLQLSYRTVSSYKWMLLQVMFSVEFGLVMDTRIIEILRHKSILLLGLNYLVTCLKCDDIF